MTITEGFTETERMGEFISKDRGIMSLERVIIWG